jgi:spectinomycin phosphotransferase
MLSKPDIKDKVIASCLHNEYGLSAKEIVFLPIGADVNTAVYRILTREEGVYFLKLRGGQFSQASVEAPKYLSNQGIQQVIAPLTTRTGCLSAKLDTFNVILYPFIKGLNGFQRSLTELQWVEFGAALKRFHSSEFPPRITSMIHREEFAPVYRDSVKRFLNLVLETSFREPVAVEMAAFLKTRIEEIFALVNRTAELALILREQSLHFVICHGDIHAWNLLISDKNAIYIVDWDTLVIAPKERDLMFIGGGLDRNEYTPDE